MKSWSRRSDWRGFLASLIVGGALGCTPVVNIGTLLDTTTSASAGWVSTATGDVSAWATTSVSTGGAGGAPPQGAACSVTTLASGLTLPAALALQGDSLYVLTEDPQGNLAGTGILYKVPLAGGDPVILAAGQGQPHGVATDATSVYWTSSDGTVKKLPLAGGQPTVIAAGQSNPGRIVVDATSVYWGDLFDGTVMKAPLAGGAPTVLFSPGSTGVIGVLGIAVDSANIYWSGTGSLNGSGVVMKAPLGGGPATTFATGVTDWGPVVVDADSIYWTNSVTYDANMNTSPGKVMKLPLDGSGSPVTIATQLFPAALALDATTLYWGGGVIDSHNPDLANATEVSRVAPAGGVAETIAPPTVISEAGLVLCPGGACWTDAFHGTVMRFVACSP